MWSNVVEETGEPRENHRTWMGDHYPATCLDPDSNPDRSGDKRVRYPLRYPGPLDNLVVNLVTCKNEEDPLKNKDARVATTQNIDFSNTQGQITPQSEVGPGRNSNSSETLWMPLLLPRIKKNQIKMKALAWPQH